MLYKEIIELFDILDSPDASASRLVELFLVEGADSCTSETVYGEGGKATDFIHIRINGKGGENAPVLGIIGRLGGVGARPSEIGFVSDGDGALAALAAALKLARMKKRGDILCGDVIVVTHIDPDAPVRPHKPVPFMGSAVSSQDVNRHEIDSDMDAIISIDTTKGNRLVNKRGIAITPTVLDGNILPVSDDLLDIMTSVTGKLPLTLPLSQYDVTPYSNRLFHINSILQPSCAADVPTVGLAITTQSAVAGCATGASHFEDIDLAARFSIECAKRFTSGLCSFYDEQEYEKYISLYGRENARFKS